MAEVNHTVKTCFRCKAEKSITDFYADKATKDGLYSSCKQCHGIRTRNWRSQNADKAKRIAEDYYALNADRIKKRNRAWEQANPEKVAAKGKRKYYSNVEKHRAAALGYLDRNRPLVQQRKRERYWADRPAYLQKQREHKIRNPALFKKHDVIRRCSEKQAKPQWANEFFISEAYRLARLREQVCGGKWHVDHIVPLRGRTVCGLHCEANLQVIPALENQQKFNRYWPDQP